MRIGNGRIADDQLDELSGLNCANCRIAIAILPNEASSGGDDVDEVGSAVDAGVGGAAVVAVEGEVD